jgi:hypothetical protein
MCLGAPAMVVAEYNYYKLVIGFDIGFDMSADKRRR